MADAHAARWAREAAMDGSACSFYFLKARELKAAYREQYPPPARNIGGGSGSSGSSGSGGSGGRGGSGGSGRAERSETPNQRKKNSGKAGGRKPGCGKVGGGKAGGGKARAFLSTKCQDTAKAYCSWQPDYTLSVGDENSRVTVGNVLESGKVAFDDEGCQKAFKIAASDMDATLRCFQ